jgi:tuftelin-interacting protein 11
MPRRKRRNIGDDGDDSSAESDDDGFNFRGDAQEERALFENPYQYKRRRRSGRTGGFDESDEESDHERDSKNKRNDWTKAPSFISAASGPLPESTDTDENSGEVGGPSVNGAEGEDREEDQDEDGEDDEDDNEDEVGEVDGDDHSNGDYDSVSENSDSGSVSGSSRLPSQMVQEDEEQEKRSGIGSKGGIGSTSSVNHHSSAPYPSPSAFPSSFGGARAQRSFVRDAGNAAGKTPPVPLAPAELAHFGKLQGTFGARMLSKMGWQTGAGLGVTGEGIVTPIDQKQRPGKIGIAYRGFKEKTEQSKAEARRRGEVVSDDERRQGKKLGVGAAGPRSDAWKKPKKVKTKVVYKTYEQIVAEAGQESSLPGIGIIIDATGAIVSMYSLLILVNLLICHSREKCHHWPRFQGRLGPHRQTPLVYLRFGTICGSLPMLVRPISISWLEKQRVSKRGRNGSLMKIPD